MGRQSVLLKEPMGSLPDDEVHHVLTNPVVGGPPALFFQGPGIDAAAAAIISGAQQYEVVGGRGHLDGVDVVSGEVLLDGCRAGS